MNREPIFKSFNELSALLPPGARTALARAAHEAQHIADPLQREMVIEDAIARVRRQYPTYFKE
jgi:hypothetical protein